MLHYLDVILFIYILVSAFTFIVALMSRALYKAHLKEQGVRCPLYATARFIAWDIAHSALYSLIPFYNIKFMLDRFEFAFSEERQDELIFKCLKEGIMYIEK